MRPTYNIFRETESFVYIVDTYSRSVLDDAEPVYKEIVEQYPGKRIIYRDWTGVWDEIVLGPTGIEYKPF